MNPAQSNKVDISVSTNLMEKNDKEKEAQGYGWTIMTDTQKDRPFFSMVALASNWPMKNANYSKCTASYPIERISLDTNWR